jgi:hypothetical protein
VPVGGIPTDAGRGLSTDVRMVADITLVTSTGLSRETNEECQSCSVVEKMKEAGRGRAAPRRESCSATREGHRGMAVDHYAGRNPRAVSATSEVGKLAPGLS